MNNPSYMMTRAVEHIHEAEHNPDLLEDNLLKAIALLTLVLHAKAKLQDEEGP